VVGLGLIGGSIAFAARRAWPDAVIVGVDRDDIVTAARQLGAVREGATDLTVLRDADLIVLAAPVRQNQKVLHALPDVVHGDAIVTDTGSTKRSTLEAARQLPARLRFVGGHPLAGAARGGIEASRADLFERRPWLLTPTSSTAPDAIDRIEQFVSGLESVPLRLDAEAHDRILAYTSHLPQLTASALMHVVGEAVGERGLRLSGGGLADTTRVAASPATIWTDICATNADEILPALDALLRALGDMRERLAADRSIEAIFDSASRWRTRIKG
jgi:prephenate dehydrogenase